jgi:hypothetical protein
LVWLYEYLQAEFRKRRVREQDIIGTLHASFLKVEAERDVNTEISLAIQADWSRFTFGPGRRTKGIIDHIRKELAEIEEKPEDLEEWIDVVILARDGFWRHGGKPEDFFRLVEEKIAKNMRREWPAPVSEDVAVEHIRTEEEK